MENNQRAKVNIEVLPEDIKTIKIRIRKKGLKCYGQLTIPIDLIERYDLKDSEKIVIAYLSKC